MTTNMFLPDANAVTVLDEHEFTEKVRHIIRRDFFPVCDEDGKPLSDNTEMVNIGDDGAETPMHGFGLMLAKYKRKIDRDGGISSGDTLAGVSLDEFLATNTSCDNIAFERVIEKLERSDRVKPRYSWLFQNDAQQSLDSNITTFDEAGQAISERHLTRPVDTWSFNAKNSLMYYPDGKNVQSAACARKIVHSNTRIPSEAIDLFNRQPRGTADLFPVVPPPLNAPNSSLKDSLDPRQEYLQRASILLARRKPQSVLSTPCTPSSWLAARYSQKRKALDMLVPSTPTVELGAGDSPFMTWGNVEGTPSATAGSSTPSFRIADIPERDAIARKLAEDAGSGTRTRKKAMLRHIHQSARDGTPGSSFSSNYPTPICFDDSTPCHTKQDLAYPTRCDGKYKRRYIFSPNGPIQTRDVSRDNTIEPFTSPSIAATCYLTRREGISDQRNARQDNSERQHMFGQATALVRVAKVKGRAYKIKDGKRSNNLLSESNSLQLPNLVKKRPQHKNTPIADEDINSPTPVPQR